MCDRPRDEDVTRPFGHLSSTPDPASRIFTEDRVGAFFRAETAFCTHEKNVELRGIVEFRITGISVIIDVVFCVIPVLTLSNVFSCVKSDFIP